jgi:hypothetical protein
MSDRYRRALLLGLILLAAAILRFHGLGAQGLWMDEAYTINLIRESWSAIVHQLRVADDAPPFFYLLERGVIHLLGEGETATRFLPALAGLGCVAAAWSVGRLVSRRVAFVSALVFAFSGLAVFYSQQARSYSLIHLLSLLLLRTALPLREKPTPLRTAAFGLCGLALLYTHNLGIWIVLTALLTAAPGFRGSRAGRRQGVALVAALILGAIPWGHPLLTQVGIHAEQNRWIGYWWATRPLALAPLFSWGAFLAGASSVGGAATPLPAFPHGWAGLFWILAATAIFALARCASQVGWPARASARDRDPAGGGSPRQREFLRSAAEPGRLAPNMFPRTILIWSLLPCLGLLATSVVVAPAYVVGRTDTLALPGFLLALAFGWATARPRWIAPAALGLWALAGFLLLASSSNSQGSLYKRSDRDLAMKIASEIRPGDALVTSSMSRPTIEYYAHQLGFWDRLSWFGSFPPGCDASPTAAFAPPIDSAGAYSEQALALRGLWERTGTGRTWILALSRDGISAGAPFAGTAHSAWPQRPTPPTAARRLIDADGVSFPMNILLADLVASRPVAVLWEYRQDWMGGDRLVLRLDRSGWVPRDSLPRIEVKP